MALTLPPSSRAVHQGGECDPHLWGALLGRDAQRRERAVRTIRALETEEAYARALLAQIPYLQVWQRPFAGDALALLGDVRFSPPYYLPEMIPVPGGVAILGSDEYADERPQHAVEVAAFVLAQTPVTQAAYAVFVQATGRRAPRGWRKGRPNPAQLNCPVVYVSARDAEAYCAWLSRETGHRYRLPTEAEWVLAARGAGDRRAFPWGNERDTDMRANAWGKHPLKRLCAVGLFPLGRGPYGHDDLAGNVWEWCSSLYWPYPYRAGDGREDPDAEELRVMHGGSWRSRPFSIRCAARQGELPSDSFEVVGFRLARDVSSAG